ncbi:hypothetical protein [Halomonas sp. SL1]|uniref:hypothetical protein n=1 Tax=Halomonas sp. SL1 TaxID=2137478 RepID=UPI0011B93826|nr:hypothetical protein [Halomonas sp. SL1]
MKGSVQWLAAGAIILSAGMASSLQADDARMTDGFGSMQEVSADVLEQARGRDVNVHLDQVTVQSIQDMQAISAGSSFKVVNGDMVTGNITFEGGSMGHYSGTGIFNNVTGNANAINNAIGISVYIANP